jgi:hypothetical protein
MLLHPSFTGEILQKYGIPLKSHATEARTVIEYENMYGAIHYKILQEMGKYKYKIVSLGTSCFVRFTLGRYGLKPFKFEGEKSHPFDLSIHPISSIIECIRTDFNKYLDLNYISQDGNNFNHALYNAGFIHENDLNGDKKMWLERYKKRIDNFRELYGIECPIFFIMMESGITMTNDLYNQLIDCLSEKFKNYKFIYLTTQEADCPVYFDNVISFYKHIQLPTKDYKWQTSGYSETDVGIEFDLKTVEFVRNIIENSLTTK